MTWGSWGKQLSRKGMAELMNFCLTQGISTFDHADIYGEYGNEEAFGDAFLDSGIDREHIQLITKCGIQMTRGRNNSVKHYQYDAAYIVWSAERSLKKLRTDYLDLFLLHRPSPLMVPEEIAKAVEQLKKEGKIKQFGVSNFTPSQIALLEKYVKIEGNQVECSLTHVNPMEDGTFDDCMGHGRMVMAWSPLGSYFREEDEIQQRVEPVLKQLSEKYNAEASQLLLAFVLKHPAKVFPVVGTTNKERLSGSIEALKIELELKDWFTMLEASKGRRVP